MRLGGSGCRLVVWMLLMVLLWLVLVVRLWLMNWF